MARDPDEPDTTLSEDRRTVSLRAPFVDLAEFPTETLPSGTVLWRVVTRQHVGEPVWFGGHGDGRFDLHPQDASGVCYAAGDAAAAILEAGFRDADLEAGRLVLTPAMLAHRRLRAVTVPGEILVADVGAADAVAFGVTGELASLVPYVLPQWWAQALQARGPTGLGGVLFAPRHAPGRWAVTLFGQRGAGQGWPSEPGLVLDATRLRQTLAGTGVTVLEPPPGTGGLTMLD